MTEVAVFFGSTWTVNFFVILMVLGLILAGTVLVLRGWAPSTMFSPFPSLAGSLGRC